jgi:hypothetical protein
MLSVCTRLLGTPYPNVPFACNLLNILDITKEYRYFLGITMYLIWKMTQNY